MTFTWEVCEEIVTVCVTISGVIRGAEETVIGSVETKGTLVGLSWIVFDDVLKDEVKGVVEDKEEKDDASDVGREVFTDDDVNDEECVWGETEKDREKFCEKTHKV